VLFKVAKNACSNDEQKKIDCAYEYINARGIMEWS